MNHYIPLVVAAVLLAGGCGKKEDAQPVASQPSLMKPGDPLPPVAPTPPLPAPNVPKGGEAPSPHLELPHPGQAGDQSSPAFKGGGQPDKTN
jgi:hypothetical protein